MIKRVHHVGLVVQDLASGYALWRDTLGLPLVREAEVKDQGVRAALLACGSVEIELLEPTMPDRPVGRFLETHGEGLHHLCFESDDVARDVKRFDGTGVEMIDARPRKGLAGMIAFIHPRACAGILVEVATPTEKTPPVASPLSLTVVHLVVEGVEGAAHLYRDLFGLTIKMSRPDWTLAQLASGDVVLQLSPAGGTSGKSRISMLRIMTRDLPGLATRLQEQNIVFRQEAVGLVLGPAATRGVLLVIHQPQA
jgi:methylmalonyl-CoA/ethylmalonyl-CoA epimerase